MKKYALLLILILTTSCAGAVSDGCTWTRTFTPDPGFETRWTRAEKEQAVSHNRARREFCS